MTRVLRKNKTEGFTQHLLGRGAPVSAGFTLVELLVAVALFGVAIVFALGSIISVLDANSKAQALTTVMNNLNFALESMTREMRFGNTYHCTTATPLNTPLNCSNGSNFVALQFQGQTVVYRLNNNRIERSGDGGTTYIPITAPEIVIENMKFYVVGTGGLSQNTLQPRITITIRGKVAPTTETQTSFTLQTTVSQRFLDY